MVTLVPALAGWVILLSLAAGFVEPAYAAVALAVCLYGALYAHAASSTVEVPRGAAVASRRPASEPANTPARSSREIELRVLASDLGKCADTGILLDEAATRLARAFDASWVEILTAGGDAATFETDDEPATGTSISVSLPTERGAGHLALEARATAVSPDLRDDLHRASLLVADALDRLRSRELLESAEARAEETERAKRDFIANTSHEVRTPLSGIIGSLEVLAATELDDAQSELVDAIRGCSESLLSLMDDVLELASLEAGAADPEIEPFDPVAVLRDVVDRARDRADSRVEVTANWNQVLEDGLVGAGTAIERALGRLADNAAAFTREGRIVVSATALDHGRRDDGRLRVRFAVEDTGPGIAPHRRDAIFDRFSQADGRSTREHEGAGLGLAIADETISRLGSTIELDSEIGRGSTFAFVLDLEQQPRAALPRAPLRSRATSPIRRVLVVDDNPVNVRVARHILERKGLVVDDAANGLEAVERALNGSFDLILMDIQMPEMDGIEATRTLVDRWRREGRMPSPIVALTAHTMDEHRWRCLDAGMADFLAKPLRSEELDAVLEELVDPGLGVA
ncbi:MAG: response regulator [Planctomycetota bacterium]